MQAHLEEPQSAKVSSPCSQGRWLLRPPLLCSSRRVGHRGALRSAPAPNTGPCHRRLSPWGQGMLGIWPSLSCWAVHSSLNISVCLLFHHPPPHPPFQICIGYYRKHFYLPLLFHFISQKTALNRRRWALRSRQWSRSIKEKESGKLQINSRYNIPLNHKKDSKSVLNLTFKGPRRFRLSLRSPVHNP